MSEWQPIETAPKSGSRKLVWVDLKGMNVNDRSFSDIGCWDGEFWRHGYMGPKFDPQPTHWQPLPEPPK